MNVQPPIGGTGPVSSGLSSLLWLAGQKINVQLPIGGTGPASSRLSPLLLLAGQKNECLAPYWWNRPSQFQTQSPPLIGGTRKWMFSSLLVEQAQSVPDSVPSSYWRDKKNECSAQLTIGGTGPVSSRLSSLLWLARGPYWCNKSLPPPDDSRVVFQGRADKETALHLACRSGNMDLIRQVVFT